MLLLGIPVVLTTTNNTVDCDVMYLYGLSLEDYGLAWIT